MQQIVACLQSCLWRTSTCVLHKVNN